MRIDTQGRDVTNMPGLHDESDTILREFKCICCGTEIDETEYGDVRDADICGYCFTDRINDISRRNLEFCSGLNDVGIRREIGVMADCELRLEIAEGVGNKIAVEIYERMLRLLRL